MSNQAMPMQPVDPLYERAMEFAKNFKRHSKRPGISNLYVIQKKDLDGNVIDEKYGMNLMTDYGMSQFFVSAANFPTQLFVGNGSGSFNHTTNTLISAITNLAATNTSTTINYNYPLYYDNVAGLVTCVAQFLQCYYDYNITDVTGAVTISEYGIGTAYNELWTHSWVYDNLGNQSTITKEINTRLEITVYFCMSYETSLITNAWDLGRYIVITSMQRFFTGRMYENAIHTYKRNGSYTARTTNRTKSLYANNKISMITNLSPMTIYADGGAAGEYIDGFVSWMSGCMMIDRCKESTPEAFSYINNPDDTYIKSKTGYSDTFGILNHIPITQANISKSYTFNPSTGQYDLEDSFVQDPSIWYTETSLSVAFPNVIRYTNNNTIMTAYVYVNQHTEDPILKIDSALTTVYATDTYWDTSTWQFISDLTNIPVALQTKRYYITTSNSISIKPIRQKQRFAYLCTDGNQFIDLSTVTYPSQFADSTSNPGAGWFAFNNYAYEFSGRATKIHSSSGYTYCRHICYNNSLFTYTNGKTYYVTDMGAAVPTPVSYTNLVDKNMINTCCVTDTKSGRVIISDYSNARKCEKVDFRDPSNVTRSLITNCVFASAIMLTDHYVMIDYSSPRDVLVKDFDTDTTLSTFTIDSSLPVPTLVFGFKDHVYVTDCANYMFLCNVTSEVVTRLSTQFDSNMGGNNRDDIRTEALDDTFIIYRTDSAYGGYSYVFSYDNPLIYRNFTFCSYSQYNSSYMKHALTKINNGTIVDIITGSHTDGQTRRYIVDIGKYCYDGTTTGAIIRSSSADKAVVLYGEYLIIDKIAVPVANMVPHKLVGTTETVSTINDIRHITDKQWSITVTNLTQWNGKPPGNPQ